MRDSAKAPPSASLAKLSTPRLAAVHARTRLFRLLDQARRRPIVWIEGPAGAGKTTLAASYLAARGLKHLWYQIDERDRDPAAFFYYLRETVRKAAPRKHETLPPLTPEYLQGLPVYARNFFEQVFARLKAPSVLVLDNFQDLPEDAILHRVVPEVLEVVPERVAVFVLSRGAPPPAFARFETRKALARIEARELRLTLDEARALAVRYGVPSSMHAILPGVHKRMEGWTAGWILFLEHARRTGFSHDSVPPETRTTLFDYFGAELFSRATPAMRQLLTRSAILSECDSGLAAQLTGLRDANRILDDLVRRNFFTTRHAGAQPVYQYHPLFREFLLAQLREAVTPEEWRELHRRAAELAAGSDHPEEAGALLIAGQDPEGLAALVLRYAETFARTGRYATLGAWLAALPPGIIDADPWLGHWAALAGFGFDPAGAMTRMLRVMDAFASRGDMTGLGHAFAAHADMFVANFCDFRDLDALDRFVALLERESAFPSREFELRVINGMLTVLLWNRPSRELVEPSVRRALRLLREPVDPHVYLRAAHQLVFYHLWWGKTRHAEHVFASASEVRDWSKVDPLLASIWSMFEAVHGYHVADFPRMRAAIERSLAIAESKGVRAALPQTYALAAQGALSQGDVDGAAGHLARMESCIRLGLNFGTSWYRALRGWEALQRHDLPRAIELLESSLMPEIGMPTPQIPNRFLYAQALAEANRIEEARQQIDAVEAIAERMGSSMFRFVVGVSRADAALRAGDEAAAARLLRDALRVAREAGVVNYPGWRRAFMSRMLGKALALGVETEYALSLIRRHRLAPPVEALDSEIWPWPVTIRALGRLEVIAAARSPVAGGKGQTRPHELLKALVALGGRDVDGAKLADLLWPEAEGDRVRQSFKVTLHRLRALLGSESVLGSEKGLLTLDPERVWLDVWALERALGALEAALGRQAEETLGALAGRAVSLYRGPLLDGETAPWALSARERLRARFLRLLAHAAEAMAAREPRRAIALYEKALEVDPLAERFYQGVMRCYRHLDLPAEGLSTYRRCRDALQRELGLPPSAATEALRAALRQP